MAKFQYLFYGHVLYVLGITAFNTIAVYKEYSVISGGWYVQPYALLITALLVLVLEFSWLGYEKFMEGV